MRRPDATRGLRLVIAQLEAAATLLTFTSEDLAEADFAGSSIFSTEIQEISAQIAAKSHDLLAYAAFLSRTDIAESEEDGGLELSPYLRGRAVGTAS